MSTTVLDSFPMVNTRQLCTEGGKIDILLGVDIPEIHQDMEIYDNGNGVVAKRTPLGWVFIGGDLQNYVPVSVNLVQNEVQAIAKYFETESMGIRPHICERCEKSDSEDNKFIQKLNDSIILLEEGRCQVKLPWRRDPQILPNNYELALKRLEYIKDS